MSNVPPDLPTPGTPPPPPTPPTPGAPVGPPPTPGSAPAAAPSVQIGLGTLLGIIAVACLALAVSVEEDGDNGWGRIGVWSAVAILAAALTLAPAVRSSLNLTVQRAGAVAAVGGVTLAAFWVLFVLPVIERNTSFLATVGCVAGCAAAWRAPGRPRPQAPASGSW